MTDDLRAVQLWSLLALAARNQQLLNYTTVGDLIGLQRNHFSRALGRIAQYCKDEKLPRLTDIVVSERNGLPMYMQADDEQARALKFFSSKTHVFAYDWLKKPPKPEYFQKDWIED